jgi:hypothetical protein
MASPARFLDGAGGRLARSTPPQLEDEASATDLQKRRTRETKSQRRIKEIEKRLGLGFELTCATGAQCRRRRGPRAKGEDDSVSEDGERRRDEISLTHMTRSRGLRLENESEG